MTMFSYGRLRRLVKLFIPLSSLLVSLLAATTIHADAPSPNLLADGDFEAPPTWPMQDGIGEVQVAPGWRAWYLDVAPPYVQVPANCNNNRYGYACYWMRPEFRDTVAVDFSNRVHSGSRAQKYFSFGRMHEAGLMQQVSGIRPGTNLLFSIYIQAWQCFDISACGKNGIRSDAPANMHLRVGIDPTGGTNPFGPSVVWGAEQEAFDRWVNFSVTARARASTVTVFTHSRAEWDWARQDNDVYLDDASLLPVGATVAPVPAVRPAVRATGGATAPVPTPPAPVRRHYSGWQQLVEGGGL